MTEHQTRVTLVYRSAMKTADAIITRRRQDEAMALWFKYVNQFRKAYRGGDRFEFSRVTRRYLKQLRNLTSNGAG
jgi:hypothetical protein